MLLQKYIVHPRATDIINWWYDSTGAHKYTFNNIFYIPHNAYITNILKIKCQR